MQNYCGIDDSINLNYQMTIRDECVVSADK